MGLLVKTDFLTVPDGKATRPGAPWSVKYTKTWSLGPLKIHQVIPKGY